MSSNTTENRYMEFKLGDQSFSIPLLSVREVIQMPEITPMPNMPSHFEGMINLRGQILGVFNVHKRLGVKAKQPDKTTPAPVVIIVEELGVNVGFIVDEVSKVIHVTENMKREAPLKEGDPAKAFVSGVIQHDQELILILSLNSLLDLTKYKSMQQAG